MEALTSLDYAFTRPSSLGPCNMAMLLATLTATCPKVKAVTVAQHCEPYVVFAHCSEPLTPEERAAVEQVVQAHRAQKQDGA